MQSVRAKNTSPEMRVRAALHAAGHRYRLHARDLPGRPDVVLPRYRVVVFVHGCFWHWHGCARCRMPAERRDYWLAKIARNVERDRRTREALERTAWHQVVIWECELDAGVARLLRLLNAARPERRAARTASEPE